MGALRKFGDSLVNLVANLGTPRDKASGAPSIQAAVKPLFSLMRPFARPRLYRSTASAASAARHRSVHQGACAKMRRKP